jgi:hypothetical protein
VWECHRVEAVAGRVKAAAVVRAAAGNCLPGEEGALPEWVPWPVGVEVANPGAEVAGRADWGRRPGRAFHT